jgi:hypothetical protein
MAASDTPMPSVIDLKALMDAAFRNLGQANADADYQQQSANQNLSRLLGESDKNRKKGMVKSRENSSSRGLLHSGIALAEQGDVSESYDMQNAGTQRSYDDVIREIAAKRLNAQNQYADSQVKYKSGVAQETAMFDPYNWQAIDADMKAKGLGPYAAANPDPYGWAAIDADMKAKGLGPYAPKPRVANPLAKSVAPAKQTGGLPVLPSSGTPKAGLGTGTYTPPAPQPVVPPTKKYGMKVV